MSRAEPAPGTLGALALVELRALARAIGAEHHAPRWAAAFADLAAPCAWWRRPAAAPPLPSGVSHRRPFSFSITLDGVTLDSVTLDGVTLDASPPQLRFFLEAQAEPPSADAYWRAGAAVTARMAAQGADLGRLRAVEDLFVPTDPRAPFRVWHGGIFTPKGAPIFKIYLCAAAQGRAAARPNLQRALDRLSPGWTLPDLDRPGLDEWTILSLDLAPDTLARIKLYLLQRDVGLDALERLYALGRDSAPFASLDPALLVDGLLGPEGRRPLWWLSCLHHTPLDAAPTGCAIHLPLQRHLPRDDAARRLHALAEDLRVDPTPLRAALDALPAGCDGLHFASLQRIGDQARITAYFAPRRPDDRPTPRPAAPQDGDP